MSKDYPNNNEIKELLNRYHVPKLVLNHCKKVKEVAVFLAKKLNEKGENYNLELISAAAELHDIGKAMTFKEIDVEKKEDIICADEEREKYEFWFDEKKKFDSKSHAKIAVDILNNYPLVAEIIGNHTPKQINNKNLSKETILINYIDKRIIETKIVHIKIRFDYFKKKYGAILSSADIINKYLQIENELFEKLDFSPEELEEKIKENGQ
jgi:putative nucleotidyltransferase with HDIG domain